MYLKTIDKIAWFIPFRNLRDNVRYKLINKYTKYYKDKKFLLNEIKDINIQKNVFKANVNRIEIEIHSYCNRKCWFCPNSIIDRHSKYIELNENIYINFLEDLKSIDYSEVLCFHRYNEPLANKDLLLNRIKQAKEYIPKVNIEIFTNGDYLTKEYLDELKNAEISSIRMAYYLEKNEVFNKKEIIKSMEKIIDKLGLSIDETWCFNDQFIELKLFHKDIHILYRATDFSRSYNSRGGLIKGINDYIEEKKFQCYYTFDKVSIDYSGNVMPCCHLRSDSDTHKSMILGDLNEDNIFSIFTNNKTANTRKYLSDYSIKKEPCNTCFMF